MKKLAIDNLKPGDHVYLNMRFFDFKGWMWYDSIGFPDKVHPYYVHLKAVRWNTKNSRRRIICHVLSHGNLAVVLDAYDIYAYVINHNPTPAEGHILYQGDIAMFPKAFDNLLHK